MKIIHIVGRTKSGKTTLIVDLVRELTDRGRRVGTLKHSGHAHELDRPGKDSWTHRQAGSIPAAVTTTDQMAVFLPRQPDENPFERLAALFSSCDVVLVEGYIEGPGVKLEVWRAAREIPPICAERSGLTAVITDDPVQTDLPVWPRSDVKKLADKILAL